MGHLELERAMVLNHMAHHNLEQVPDSNHVGHVELECATESNHVGCLNLDRVQDLPPLPPNRHENHLEEEEEFEQENGGGGPEEQELTMTRRERREEGHELNTELRILITREIRKPGRRKCSCWGQIIKMIVMKTFNARIYWLDVTRKVFLKQNRQVTY